jgi:hypothetical protein
MTVRIGIEFEWLAPKGLSRQTYAQVLAAHYKGSVVPFWHPQVEPTKIPGTPLFHNLTQGFSVLDAQGKKIAHTVGDLTIQKQLNRNISALPGWVRIVSDDLRLLLLTARNASPINDLSTMLSPIADLFGTKTKKHDQIVRVEDEFQSSIVLGAPMPGERERVCEVVSGILENPTLKDVNTLIAPAKKLGFLIPIESATHIHFCAKPLQNAHTLRSLIHLLHGYRWVLRSILHTNPHCIRLGSWPEELFHTIEQPDFLSSSWEQVQQKIRPLPLTKFCDFNIKNLIHGFTNKNTFELRILPGLMESEPVLEAVSLFMHIFECAKQRDIPFIEPKEATAQNQRELLDFIEYNIEQR